MIEIARAHAGCLGDGLDLPLVAEMEATFYEPFPKDAQQVERPVGDSERRYGLGQLR